MTPSDKNEVYLSSSPSIHTSLTTQKIMLIFSATLLPLCVAGALYFGKHAVFTILASVLSCVIFEALFRKIIKKESHSNDCSALVTGLLLALSMPPTVPILMTILGAFFAIVVAKEFFGGIGANVFNPALAGRAFLFTSFSVAMGRFEQPFIHAITKATPLSESYQMGELETFFDWFLGKRPGCIGETCTAWIIIAFVILVAIKIIDWRTPVFFIGTVVVYSLVFCGENPLHSVLTGGLLFGAVFMATDYATTPITPKGKALFGVGCGLITALIRHFSSYPEGVMFSILIMNAFSGFLNRLVPKKYGFVAKKGGSK